MSGLVTVGGYDVQDLSVVARPLPPEQERRLWCTYHLQGERGRTGLERHRPEFARLLWSEWSPGWAFTDAEFAATASSFDDPDFVDVVLHSYRHRYGLVPGDQRCAQDERRIARLPVIDVPTVVVDGLQDGLRPPEGSGPHARHFSRLVADPRSAAGHNPPQEASREFADAVGLLLDRLPAQAPGSSPRGVAAGGLRQRPPRGVRRRPRPTGRRTGAACGVTERAREHLAPAVRLPR